MPRKGRVWTPEQKERQSQAMKAYWATHQHPRKGVETPPETKELMRQSFAQREVKGQCLRCGLPLAKDESVKLGLGPACYAAALEDGEIERLPDGSEKYNPFGEEATS